MQLCPLDDTFCMPHKIYSPLLNKSRASFVRSEEEADACIMRKALKGIDIFSRDYADIPAQTKRPKPSHTCSHIS